MLGVTDDGYQGRRSSQGEGARGHHLIFRFFLAHQDPGEVCEAVKVSEGAGKGGSRDGANMHSVSMQFPFP